VPFDDLQKQLDMQARDFTDAAGNPGQDPARCNSIELSLKDGFSPDLVKPKIEQIVQSVLNKYPSVDDYSDDPITVETWEENRGQILSAVEHEKILLVILFAIISVVAIFLIFCIFYMIVVEKTRDIGIIKSVGATGSGVAAIFLGYGLVIGILGAGMGLLCGYLVVHNINELHAWMGRAMGIKIWDPQTYVFDTIPNTMERADVIVIVTVAILSSVVGAIVPAIRAARLNPVEALRWE
jgi:lipoprotein-releasing system permease protein